MHFSTKKKHTKSQQNINFKRFLITCRIVIKICIIYVIDSYIIWWLCLHWNGEQIFGIPFAEEFVCSIKYEIYMVAIKEGFKDSRDSMDSRIEGKITKGRHFNA